MRKIKFRAWDKEVNCWLDYNEIFIDQDGDVYFIEERSWAYQSYMHKERITEKVDIVWFTGLKDKNGKEIYEGDIVSTDLSRPFLIVEFRNGAFMYQCHHNKQDYYDHMEPAFSDVIELTKYHAVIGNIYENSELLGASE